jgi:hypothetical protein
VTIIGLDEYLRDEIAFSEKIGNGNVYIRLDIARAIASRLEELESRPTVQQIIADDQASSFTPESSDVPRSEDY